MDINQLKGQPELRRALSRELTRGFTSHAVLLTGPAGSGKKTWGKALAQALLCPLRREAEPCMSCLSCRQFQSGNHPWFFPLEPEGRWLKVDQLREIRGRFYLEGNTRVCLIDKADQMTAVACSSLLKILEDPPPGLYFILLAEQARRLFSTIVSRCRHFSLHPLSTADILDLLRQRSDFPPEKAALISCLSNGLPGPALELAGDPGFECRLDEAAELAGGLVSGKDSPRELLDRAAGMAEREDLVPFMELVYLFFRDGLIWLLCGKEALLVNPANARFWRQKYSPHCLEQAMDQINTAIRDILTTNVNRRLAVEGMLIQLQRRFDRCPG